MAKKSFHAEDVPMVGASVISLICCVWLVARSLPRIPKKYKKKLLLRQLWHLAIADIIMSLGGFALNFAQLSAIPESRGDETCHILQNYVYTLTNGLGLFTSILAETHIALGFVLGLYRCTSAYRCMERALPVIWVLGLLLSVLDSLTSEVYYDTNVGMCRSNFKYGVNLMRPVQVVTVFFTTGVMCAGYCALVCCSGLTAGPSSVERRVWRSGVRFVLVFLATWGPWLLSGHFIEASWALGSSGIWAYISGITLGLNGALNCITYASFSRYVRQMRDAQGRAHRPQQQTAIAEPRGNSSGSFHVAFSGEEVQTYLVENLEDHPAYWEPESPDTLSNSNRGASLEHLGSVAEREPPLAMVDARN